VTKAVQVSDVDKTFHSGDSVVHALKNVTLEARFGELAMIVGPSGCGKTTLLSVIAGTLNYDKGEIELFGQNLRSLNDAELTEFRKKNVGFIFQHYRLIPTLSVLDNVTVPLILNGVHYKEAEARSAEVLGKVGLKGKESEHPGTLSGGQQQRVAIARALVHEPRLIICDEPTAALDAETGHIALELLVNVARSPERSVIIVTHDNRIYKYADRMFKMDDGRITEQKKE